MMPDSPMEGLKRASSDPALCAALTNQLAAILSGRQMRFMEVCGTHTTAIFQSGLRAMLPENVIHVSGPGCPVCVTHDAEVALFLQLARRKGTILATFGDLLRIPDAAGESLKHAMSQGADVRMVYSPLDALKIADSNQDKDVVFLGAGFETTAPAVGASVLGARQKGLKNYSVLSMHKLIPPAIRALLDEEGTNIDGFLLPGHVATVTGLAAFNFIPDEYQQPGVVGGFEPVDILLALRAMARQLVSGSCAVENAYPRAVSATGNARAQAVLTEVFEPCAASWRGLGQMQNSGLAIRPEFSAYDAFHKFSLTLPKVKPIAGCQCGEVLKGRISPGQCPLFGTRCTPANPVGPCMVSTEGSCAASFKYGV